MILIILESAYELSCEHVPRAALDNMGFITIRNGTEMAEILTERYFFVSKICTMTAVLFRDCLAY